jgi:hypothetical protein
MKIGERDLSAALPLLSDADCVVDEKSGIFIAKLPTPAEGFRIVCHPAWKVERERVLFNGSRELKIRRK